MTYNELQNIVSAKDIYEYAKEVNESSFNKEFEDVMNDIRYAAQRGEYMAIFGDVLSFEIKSMLLQYGYFYQDCDGQTVVYFKK